MKKVDTVGGRKLDFDVCRPRMLELEKGQQIVLEDQ